MDVLHEQKFEMLQIILLVQLAPLLVAGQQPQTDCCSPISFSQSTPLAGIVNDATISVLHEGSLTITAVLAPFLTNTNDADIVGNFPL